MSQPDQHQSPGPTETATGHEKNELTSEEEMLGDFFVWLHRLASYLRNRAATKSANQGGRDEAIKSFGDQLKITTSDQRKS